MAEAVNEIVEEANHVEEPKPEAEAKPKASDKVSCKTCDKSMTYST